MDEGRRTRIARLEARVASLEDENAMLIDRAEDILLLGLVTEAISHQVEVEEIIATVLERVSILKDIPYCALVTVDGVLLTLAQEYTVLRDETPRGVRVELPKGIVAELDLGATPVPVELLPNLWASLGFAQDSEPVVSAFLVPFVTTHHERAALLIADPTRAPETLGALLPLLEQVIRAAAARIENASLFSELEELTENLNRLVRERTAELYRANTHLEREAAERRRAEKELRLAATVFASSHDAIVITDPDMTIRAVNAAFCRTTGYSEDEILGRKAMILVADRHDRAFFDELQATLGSTGGWRGEIWSRRKSGDASLQLLSITEVRNRKGELSLYFGLFSHIGK